jgi:hypothetical protein
MRSKLLKLLLAAVLLLAGGCVSWQYGGSAYSAGGGDYTLQVPGDWLFIERPKGHVLATKESQFIHRVEVERRELKAALPNSKRPLAATLTPLELAEALLDDLRADRSIHQPNVLENAPTQVGGRPGFRFTVSFQTEDHLRLTMAVHGCIEKNRLYLVKYTAPTRHYFERDRAVFDRIAASLKFKN